MRIAINQGISENQLLEIISVFEKSVGKIEAESARKVFAEISGTKTTPAVPRDQNIDLVFPKGQTGPSLNMTGTVWVYSMLDHDSLMTTSVGNVTFEPVHARIGILISLVKFTHHERRRLS